MQGSYDVLKLIVPAILTGLLAWLYASLTKVSKSEHQEALRAQEVRWTERCGILERLIEKQGERNSKFESALSDKVSRSELKESLLEMKEFIQQIRADLKEDFQTLRADIRKVS